MIKIQKYALISLLTCVSLAFPSVASAYCKAVLINPFNGAIRDRFGAHTCRDAVMKCLNRAHGPQRCYIVSSYRNHFRN